MSATAPNLNAVNETIAFLSNAVAETESKLKTEEEKRKKLTKECDLLSNEIQNKAMEITQLRKENDELIKENTDLKQKLDKNDKEIEDLSLFKSIHEKQNYDFLMEQKKKVELEKIEIEDKYNEMKANFENEHKNLINLDKQFYEYKKEVEAQAIKDKELKEKLEKEIIEQKDEIEITKKNYKETDNKLKEALDVVKNLQKENSIDKDIILNINLIDYNKYSL